MKNVFINPESNLREAYKRNRWCLLDTSFILSAIKCKIDFIEGILFLGLTPIIPMQVIDELKNITKSKKKFKFKDNAELALKIIQKNKLKEIDIKHKYVDKGIIQYSKENPEVIIATMDKELKTKIKNKKLVVRAMKKLEIL